MSSSSSSVGGGPRSISLQRDAQSTYVDGAVTGFRFTVQAHDAVDMPNEIFRYLRVLNLPEIGQSSDQFHGVCSPVDLDDWPIGDPGGAQEYPFFRKDALDLVFPSQQIAEDAWLALQRDVNVLVRTLNIMDRLGESENVTLTGA